MARAATADTESKVPAIEASAFYTGLCDHHELMHRAEAGRRILDVKGWRIFVRIERALSTDDGAVVQLYLEGPNASERELEYYCIIGLDGGGISERRKIYGIDQFQAVILSLRHLNFLAEKAALSIAPRELSWKLGDNENIFGLTL